MLHYRVRIKIDPDEKVFSTYHLIDFDKIPIVVKTGERTLKELEERAVERMLDLCAMMISNGIAIPISDAELSEEKDVTNISMHLGVSFKILIWNEMLKKNIDKNMLAAKMGKCTLVEQVTRLLDIDSHTGMDLFDRAIRALDSPMIFKFK